MTRSWALEDADEEGKQCLQFESLKGRVCSKRMILREIHEYLDSGEAYRNLMIWGGCVGEQAGRHSDYQWEGGGDVQAELIGR